MENFTEKEENTTEVQGEENAVPPPDGDVSEETASEPKVYGDKVLTPAQKRKRTVLQWTIMTLGIVLMSLSVYFFQTPNRFTLGGVAGIALLLAKYTPPMTQSYWIIIINVALIIIGLITLGRSCTIKTIFCSLLYSAIIWVLEYFNVLGLITGGQERLTDQPFLELVYAILMFGIGGALVFNCGGTSGGTDIIAMILKKFTSLNIGMSLLIIDFIVVTISFFSFMDYGVQTGLYSFLGLFTKSFLLDGVIEGMGKTKCITIITEHPEETGEYILKIIKHGYTTYDAEGGYTGAKKKVLVTVCKRSEALKLKNKVKACDPQSFVIITDANEILGKGFGGTL